mmetsp:Transcript_53047/g.119530  ORF Transcript_53047/g.119530 Transcript_53047/m.119530 type:complete len:248 (+) Transcript_53047:832-1575(+)
MPARGFVLHEPEQRDDKRARLVRQYERQQAASVDAVELEALPVPCLLEKLQRREQHHGHTRHYVYLDEARVAQVHPVDVEVPRLRARLGVQAFEGAALGSLVHRIEDALAAAGLHAAHDRPVVGGPSLASLRVLIAEAALKLDITGEGSVAQRLRAEVRRLRREVVPVDAHTLGGVMVHGVPWPNVMRAPDRKMHNGCEARNANAGCVHKAEEHIRSRAHPVLAVPSQTRRVLMALGEPVTEQHHAE